MLVELENKKKVDATGDHDVDEEMWDDDAVQVAVTLFRDAKVKPTEIPTIIALKLLVVIELFNFHPKTSIG